MYASKEFEGFGPLSGVRAGGMGGSSCCGTVPRRNGR